MAGAPGEIAGTAAWGGGKGSADTPVRAPCATTTAPAAVVDRAFSLAGPGSNPAPAFFRAYRFCFFWDTRSLFWLAGTLRPWRLGPIFGHKAPAFHACCGCCFKYLGEAGA